MNSNSNPLTVAERQQIERARVARTTPEWQALPVVRCACGQKFYQEHPQQQACRDCMTDDGTGFSFYPTHAADAVPSEVLLRDRAPQQVRRRSGVEVHVTDYEFAHGKRPSGRGSWAFSPKRNPAADDRRVIWAHDALYSEAKRHAITTARELGFAELWVLS